MGDRIRTAVNFPAFRSAPLNTVKPFVKALEEATVDYIWSWDLLSGWMPKVLWKPDVMPAATVISDPDSFYDVRVVMGMAAEAASSLGVLLTTNTMRHGPAEVLQTMLTLASATKGKALFAIGAGEAYNYVPFGYSRPIARFEDHLRLYRLLLESDDPINFDGNIWNYRDAHIGTVRTCNPEFWALGGGPRLIDIACQYADGFMTVVPWGISTPERFAVKVEQVRRKVESYGRDPDKFGFGIQAVLLLSEDGDFIRRAYEVEGLKFIVAISGRLKQADWMAEGISSIYPEHWHYAREYLPTRITEDELRVTTRVSPQMMAKSFIAGDPKEVVSQLQGYVDAGATVICPIDFLAMAQPLEGPSTSFMLTLEVCRRLTALDE